MELFVAPCQTPKEYKSVRNNYVIINEIEFGAYFGAISNKLSSTECIQFNRIKWLFLGMRADGGVTKFCNYLNSDIR